MKVLLAGPDKDSNGSIRKILEQEKYHIDEVLSGKEVQLSIYKSKFNITILDINIENYSCFEVVKYIRVTSPFVKIIVVFDSEKQLTELDLDSKNLKKIGVSEVIFRPISKEKVIKAINGEMQYLMWKRAKLEKKSGPDQEISARDDEFTKIRINDFVGTSEAIFDIYIRINENRFLKVLNNGDSFEKERIDRYTEKYKVEYLYFRTKDRGVYVHSVNNILKELFLNKKKGAGKDQELKVKMTKNLVEKFVEEVYTQGLRPHLVEEGALICENITNLVHKDNDLSKILKEYENFDPTAYHHSFLVAFFSSIICSHLDWATEVTMQKIAMEAMFHDIGKLKLNKSVALLKPKEMKPDQLEQYKMHPQLGVDLMNTQSLVSDPIKQIIYQHHERVDGSGFPRGITGIKIYPLAQVMGFCDEFAHVMVDNRMSPVAALKLMLKDKELVARFAPSILRALAESFIGHEKLKIEEK